MLKEIRKFFNKLPRDPERERKLFEAKKREIAALTIDVLRPNILPDVSDSIKDFETATTDIVLDDTIHHFKIRKAARSENYKVIKYKDQKETVFLEIEILIDEASNKLSQVNVINGEGKEPSFQELENTSRILILMDSALRKHSPPE